MLAPCPCPYDHIWSGGYGGICRAHDDVMKTLHVIMINFFYFASRFLFRVFLLSTAHDAKLKLHPGYNEATGAMLGLIYI